MPHRYLIRRAERFFVYRVLHIDDTPHRIALGLAIGIFWTWSPLLGLQMILTILTSALFRANKFVGVPFVWISNPVTAVPLYGFNFLVGAWLLPGNYSLASFNKSVIAALGEGGGFLDRFHAWWGAMIDFFGPLFVGSTVVGLILAITAYIVTRNAVSNYRKLREYRRRRRLERLATRRRKGRHPAQEGQTSPAPPPENASPADATEKNTSIPEKPKDPPKEPAQPTRTGDAS
jgi:uncharacterized protein